MFQAAAGAALWHEQQPAICLQQRPVSKLGAVDVAYLQQGKRAGQQLRKFAVQVVSVLEECGAMAPVKAFPVRLCLGLQQLCIPNSHCFI